MLFNIPQPQPIPQAQSIANSLLSHANRTLNERVSEHRIRFHEFWDNVEPPANIANAMGQHGGAYLAAASESIRHISELANIAGLSLNDIIHPSDYMPRLPLIENEDGTLSVGSVDGLDEYGRPIPVPEESIVIPAEESI